MTPEQIIRILEKANTVGVVKHADYADYCRVLVTNRRVADEWISEERLYMTVAGRLKMANDDHRMQKKRLTFSAPSILADTADYVTIQVLADSEAYGMRHGIATSRRKDGPPAERSNPYEVAETSAIGRALGAYGYGLLPEAGLASADDMQRMNINHEPEAASEGSTATPRQEGQLSPAQARLTAEAYFKFCDAHHIERRHAAMVLNKHRVDFEAAMTELKQDLPEGS